MVYDVLILAIRKPSTYLHQIKDSLSPSLKPNFLNVLKTLFEEQIDRCNRSFNTPLFLVLK